MGPSDKELTCINYAKQFYHDGKTVNYQVSEMKSFSQLWSDFGLRDYGSRYWGRGKFKREDKLTCIEYWVKTLYDIELDIKKFESEIEQELQAERLEMMKEDPSGSVSMIDAVDAMPLRIDEKFGLYEKMDEERYKELKFEEYMETGLSNLHFKNDSAYEISKEYFHKALDIYPDHSEALYNLALSYHGLNQMRLYIKYLKLSSLEGHSKAKRELEDRIMGRIVYT